MIFSHTRESSYSATEFVPLPGSAEVLLSNGKPTTSSVPWQQTAYLTSASNAVLPDASCAWAANVKQVALKPGTNHFWQVDLQAKKVITMVKLRATTLAGAI